jgi:hypothetical protein
MIFATHTPPSFFGAGLIFSRPAPVWGAALRLRHSASTDTSYRTQTQPLRPSSRKCSEEQCEGLTTPILNVRSSHVGRFQDAFRRSHGLDPEEANRGASEQALYIAWRSGMGIEPTLDGTTAQHRF